MLVSLLKVIQSWRSLPTKDFTSLQCIRITSKAETTHCNRQKKTPPKAGSLGFSLGVLPSFHSVKKPSSQMNNGSEIMLSKPLRISWLTVLRYFLSMCLVNSLKGLTPHTPRRRFCRLLFLCLNSSFRVNGSQSNEQSRQNALMWQQQPDYARYKEKLNGEGWLVNRQEGMLIQIKPDTPTQHAQFVLVSYYRLSARLGKPIRQQRMLRHLGIEMWINLQKIGWQRCTLPN
ncbi:hypothetical protein sync_0839 [Synechococcus sp. CC9311]|nr:hypothetical protein sync_0839 [Synechococcus sp. CC9311]